jgi:hypothetical protein
MTPAPIENSGTGGGLRYLSENAAPEMLNQEQSHCCQAACARQLLKDAGVEISEADLLDKIGYYEGIGTMPRSTTKALTELHPELKYDGGEIRENACRYFAAEIHWIVNLRTNRGTVHAVMVDRMEGDIVYVRDAWGLNGPGSTTGTVATIKVEDFLEHWL